MIKFLSTYWKLKYNFYFSNYIWSIDDKVFISLNNYKYKTGKILIRKTATNYIVTFTDLFGKVIYCATSYSSLLENKQDKRRRLSVFAIENIIDKYIAIFLLIMLVI